jgi:hypothetical protein
MIVKGSPSINFNSKPSFKKIEKMLKNYGMDLSQKTKSVGTIQEKKKSERAAFSS